MAWLVRLQHFVAETAQLSRRAGREQHEEQYSLLMVKGMEAQLREFQGQMPLAISSQRKKQPSLVTFHELEKKFFPTLTLTGKYLAVLHMTTLVTEIVLYGSPLLKFPYERAQKREQSAPIAYADPNRLLSCAHLLRTWYDYILSLPASEFSHFPGAIWGHFVASVILGLRLSFPIPSGCPDWDHGAARRILDFGGFLAAFGAAEGSASGVDAATAHGRKNTSTDVLSASKVVVDMVRHKYEKRLAALEMAEASQGPPHPLLPGTDKSMSKCPMLDGSLDQYIQDWDERFLDTTGFGTPIQGGSGWDTGSGDATGTNSQTLTFHDLWATMTMGWSQDGFQ